MYLSYQSTFPKHQGWYKWLASFHSQFWYLFEFQKDFHLFSSETFFLILSVIHEQNSFEVDHQYHGNPLAPLQLIPFLVFLLLRITRHGGV